MHTLHTQNKIGQQYENSTVQWMVVIHTTQPIFIIYLKYPLSHLVQYNRINMYDYPVSRFPVSRHTDGLSRGMRKPYDVHLLAY